MTQRAKPPALTSSSLRLRRPRVRGSESLLPVKLHDVLPVRGLASVVRVVPRLLPVVVVGDVERPSTDTPGTARLLLHLHPVGLPSDRGQRGAVLALRRRGGGGRLSGNGTRDGGDGSLLLDGRGRHRRDGPFRKVQGGGGGARSEIFDVFVVI